MHADPIPAQGLWLRARVPSLGPELSSPLPLGWEWRSRDKEQLGALAPPGPGRGTSGRREGMCVLEAIRSYSGCPPACEGGRQFSISFNKHLRCASDFCLPQLWGWAGTPGRSYAKCGGVTGLSLGAGLSSVLNGQPCLEFCSRYTLVRSQAGPTSWGIMCGTQGVAVCVNVCMCGSPAPQQWSQAAVLFNLLFTVDVTVILTATGRNTQL